MHITNSSNQFPLEKHSFTSFPQVFILPSHKSDPTIFRLHTESYFYFILVYFLIPHQSAAVNMWIIYLTSMHSWNLQSSTFMTVSSQKVSNLLLNEFQLVTQDSSWIQKSDAHHYQLHSMKLAFPFLHSY